MLNRDDLNHISQMAELLCAILTILRVLPLDADDLNDTIRKFKREYRIGKKPNPFEHYYSNLN